LEPYLGIPLGKQLLVLESNGRRAVFLDSTAVHVYDTGDRAAEAAAIASLSRAGVATHVELARVFGCHRNTVGRLEQRFEQDGMGGVVPAKRGPKGPRKVTPAVLEVVRELAHLGCVKVARAVEQRTGVCLTPKHVNELLHRVRADAAQQGRLPEKELAAPVPPVSVGQIVSQQEERQESETELSTEAGRDVGVTPSTEQAGVQEPEVQVPKQFRGRYMGAAVYFPALQVLGLLEAAASCFRLPGAAEFGVRAVMLTLFFLSLFGKTTLEGAKHLWRWDFGPLVGTERASVVKTLRRKLGDLIKQGQAACFGTLLARRWVEQGIIATAYLYVDGHVKAYTGKRKLVECWNPQRRMPLPGLLSYFVNDQQGRPLLFLTEEASASLSQVMPKIVAAIREVVGECPFTVIFDRGGYDGNLFAWLHSEGIDFVTYQRGEPGLLVKQFRRQECRFEGRRVRVYLAEDQVKVGHSGPWRRIVVRTKDGHQTPILTSLADPAPAKIACLIFARWRQENFFKYSRDHHGLDQLLGYAWAEADGTRLVPNPERKQVERELKAKRQELAQRQAVVGQVLLDESSGSSRTGRRIKINLQDTVGHVRTLEKEIAKLADHRASLPKRVPVAETGPRAVLRLEQKAIIDRIKMTAYNAEEWLLGLLVRHYSNPHDIRALLRSFALLTGEMRTTPTGVVVTLDAPDLPLHRRALRGLCGDLNKLGAIFPGTKIPVTYQVAMHHSEVVA
jgi:transposase